MRKIFSLALMATALLISGQVKAAGDSDAANAVAKIGNEYYSTLQKAVNDVPRAQATATEITILKSFTLNQPTDKSVVVYDRNIKLNLQGFTYTNSVADAFDFISGKLEIVGTSGAKIINNQGSTNFKSSGIRLYGTKNTAKGKAYTELIVGANVTVQGYRGIDLYTWGAGYVSGEPWNRKGGSSTGALITQQKTNNTALFEGCSEIEELRNSTKDLQSAYNGQTGTGFGVVVTIKKGAIVNGNLYGIQISGQVGLNMNLDNDYKPADCFYPIITIEDDAQVGVVDATVTIPDGNKAPKYPTGIYASNYGVWDIQGDVTGATGICVKSGDVNISGDAQISATGSYVATTENDGSKASGSAILIQSSTNRTETQIELKVGGSAEVKADSGFAVEETKVGQSNNVDSLIITGGNFITKDTVTLNTTAEIKQEIINNGTITGGNFTDETVKDYLATTGVVNQIEDEKGETVYTISSKPAEKPWKNDDINVVADGSYVQYKAENEALEFTLTKNVNIDYLSMTSKNVGTELMPEYNTITLTIPTGFTLKVGEIVMDAYAQIVVEAGGKLVVTNNNGIIAFDANNLVIKADATNGMGTFVLNPAVKANKTPWATVEYMTASACGKETTTIGGSQITDYHWDVVASPFVKIDSIVSVPTYFARFVDGEFVSCTRQDVVNGVAAFGMFAMCPNTDTTATKYTFYGKLQGVNSLDNFPVSKKFNFLGNAYMGKMNAKEMVLELQQSASVRSLVYVWNVRKINWEVYNSYDLDKLGNLNPMAAFVLYSNADGTVSLNYEKLIWNTNK